MITQIIKEKIKYFLNGIDEKKMSGLMLGHYRTLHLIDKDEKWATPDLQKASGYLLPGNITENAAKDFADAMVDLAMQNPYFVDFIKAAQNETFATLSRKIETEGNLVIPRAISWSFVLDRMTNAMYDNPAITRDCIAIFQNLRKSRSLFKGITVFYKIKLLSVEFPVKDIYLKSFETGKVLADSGRLILPLNILEATISDYLGGRSDNAKASLPLVVNRPGSKHYDPRTGAGPSAWSDDKKAPCRSMPLPTEWADLYQTWNMAYVSHFPFFPYLIPKLLIPKVADYRGKPTEYPYIRALSLYLTLYHFGLDTIERKKNNQPEIDWYDAKLTLLWGKVNLESSIKYKRELAGRKTGNHFAGKSV